MATGWEQIVAALTTGSPSPTPAGERIYIDAANDEEPRPYVIGHSIGRNRTFGLDNTLLALKETFHLECWGETRELANQLADAVVEALLAAGLVPDDNGPDGMDPSFDVRCTDVYVPTWITPQVD